MVVGGCWWVKGETGRSCGRRRARQAGGRRAHRVEERVEEAVVVVGREDEVEDGADDARVVALLRPEEDRVHVVLSCVVYRRGTTRASRSVSPSPVVHPIGPTQTPTNADDDDARTCLLSDSYILRSQGMSPMPQMAQRGAAGLSLLISSRSSV